MLQGRVPAGAVAEVLDCLLDYNQACYKKYFTSYSTTASGLGRDLCSSGCVQCAV
jgi:hypothetical protein